MELPKKKRERDRLRHRERHTHRDTEREIERKKQRDREKGRERKIRKENGGLKEKFNNGTKLNDKNKVKNANINFTVGFFIVYIIIRSLGNDIF